MIGSYFALPYFFHDFSFRLFIAHLIMLAGVDHFWSIPAEVRYYFILPIFIMIFVFLLQRRLKPTIILVLSVSLATSTYYHYYVTDIPFVIMKLLPLFLSGSLFAVLHEDYQNRISTRYNIIMTTISVICLISSLILMSNFFKILFGVPFPVREPLMFNLIALLYGLLIFSVLNQSSFVTRFFESKLMRFIGIISFSTYLWHWFILEWIVRLDTLDAWQALTLFFLLTYAISIISFLLFERPFTKLRLIHVLTFFRAHSRVVLSTQPARQL